MRRFLGIIIGILVLLAILVFAINAFRSRQAETGNRNIDLDEIKPAAWEPYTDSLLRVNLDDDPEVEWLFFYRYDGDQIGGVIYDPQADPRGANAITVPNQTPNSLVPYRLLPDYAKGKTNGYLGDREVDWKQVFADEGKDINADLAEPRQRLLVRGKREGGLINRYSVFQWQGLAIGYAGAHASTPGWFSLSKDKPQDWTTDENWLKSNASPTEIWAWEPQTDRSAICRRVKWTLQESGPAENPIEFVANYPDSDLVFCSGKIPSEPAFPEGQVLAYLLEGENENRVYEKKRAGFPKFPGGAMVRRLTAPAILDEDILNTEQVKGEVDFKWNGEVYFMTWTAFMVPPGELGEQDGKIVVTPDARKTTRWLLTSLTER